MATLRSVAWLTVVLFVLLVLRVVFVPATSAFPQTVDDGIMIEGTTLFTGYLFTYDSGTNTGRAHSNVTTATLAR